MKELVEKVAKFNGLVARFKHLVARAQAVALDVMDTKILYLELPATNGGNGNGNGNGNGLS
jgi:hypothetical protein